MTLWSERDARQAVAEGWDVTPTKIPSCELHLMMIRAADDSRSFQNDEQAFAYVVGRASHGWPLAVRALALHHCPVNAMPILPD